MQLGRHLVAVVQYTYAHTHNTQNDTKQTICRTTQKFWNSADCAPSLQVPHLECSLVSKNMKHDDTFNLNIKPPSFKCLLKHVPSCTSITAH